MNAEKDSYLFAWIIGLVIIALIICVVIYLLIAQVISSDRDNVDNQVADVDSEKGLPIRDTQSSFREPPSEKQEKPAPARVQPPPPKTVEAPVEQPKVENTTVKKSSPVVYSSETITKSEREAEPPVKSEKTMVREPVKNTPEKLPIEVKNPQPTTMSNSCPKSLSAEPLDSPNKLNVASAPKTEDPKLKLTINNNKTNFSSEICDLPEKVPEAKKVNLSVEKADNNEAKTEQKGSAEVVGTAPPSLTPPTQLSAEKTVPESTTTTPTVITELSAVVPVSSQRSEVSHFNLIEAGRTPPNEHSFGSSLVKSSSREILKSKPLTPFDGKSSETIVSMTTPPTKN